MRPTLHSAHLLSKELQVAIKAENGDQAGISSNLTNTTNTTMVAIKVEIEEIKL
jgi:hypothetical protein